MHIIQQASCALLLLLLFTISTASPHGVPGTSAQLKTAKECVSTWLGSEQSPSNHLAAVFLHSHTQDHYRNLLLQCSIRNLIHHIGTSTPLHIFVFVMEPAYERMRKFLTTGLGEHAIRVCLLPIPQEQWEHNPRTGRPYLHEKNSKYAGDYVQMGIWRMLVPYNIVAELGYPYFLQVDDDLMIYDLFKKNIVEEMRTRNYTVTTHRMPVELWGVMYGLPELAKFYLHSHDLTAGSSMWQHVTPPNITGLYSPTYNWWKPPGHPKSGYDLIYLYGNFLIMSTELWKDHRVQDWITLCVFSGGLERHRWQEQGVLTFVWLMFTDAHQLWHINRHELRWLHKRGSSQLKSICQELQPKSAQHSPAKP